MLAALSTNTLLAGQCIGMARIQLLTALPVAAVLILLLRACRFDVPRALGKGLFLLLTALLLLGLAAELLRLFQIHQSLYPGSVVLPGLLIAVGLPYLYLRDQQALQRTGQCIFWLLAIAFLIFLVSVADRLELTNLQFPCLNSADFLTAVQSQLRIYPEFLLLFLWQNKAAEEGSAKLVAWQIGLTCGASVTLELLFGAGVEEMDYPISSAAKYGAVSVFTRLEWIQVGVWTLTLSLKLALYLASIRLAGEQCGLLTRKTSAKMDSPLLLLLAGLTMALRKTSPDAIYQVVLAMSAALTGILIVRRLLCLFPGFKRSE